MEKCSELQEERGRIARVDGDFAWVEIARKPRCGGCASESKCGTAVLAKAMSSKPVLIKTLNVIAADVGDDVIVGVEQNILMSGSLSVYGVPLLLMLFSAFFGDALGQKFFTEYHNITSIIFALLGLLTGFFWLKRHSKKVAQDPRYQPLLIRQALS